MSCCSEGERRSLRKFTNFVKVSVAQSEPPSFSIWRISPFARKSEERGGELLLLYCFLLLLRRCLSPFPSFLKLISYSKSGGVFLRCHGRNSEFLPPLLSGRHSGSLFKFRLTCVSHTKRPKGKKKNKEMGFLCCTLPFHLLLKMFRRCEKWGNRSKLKKYIVC